MATYFVRITGADTNAGTSAGAAWRTVGKALGAAGIASGDTVYIGAGTYRETVTVNMVSATVETRVIGDVNGAQTGDSGEITISPYTLGDWATPAVLPPINLNGRDFLTFERLTLQGGNIAPICVDARTLSSVNIIFRECSMVGIRTAAGGVVMDITAGFAVVMNWTVERCIFFGWSSSPIQVTLTTGVGADWDANIQIRDCLMIGVYAGSTAAVLITSTGTSANEGGGVDVTSCTIIGTAGILTTTTRVGGATFTNPCTIQNCLIICAANATGIGSGELGAITDGGWNRVVGQTAYANVTANPSSRAGTSNPAVLLDIGQDYAIGRMIRPHYEPLPGSPLTSVGPSTSTVDIMNRARPEGDALWGVTGTATSGATTSITDTSKTWGVNQWTGWLVRTTGGTGPNQLKRIASNTVNSLVISGAAPGGGLWAVTPASGTTYVIYQGAPAETGKATAGAASTLTDGGANWTVNGWAGYTCAITGGLGSPQTCTILSNTANVLTRSGTWTTNPDSTSTYSLYASGGIDTPQDSVGAFERHDSAIRETTTTDAGGVSIALPGPSSHEFALPVDAVSTVITVRGRYDADHAATNKPQAMLLANGEVGVTAQTVTMTAAADTWETLTFAAITPTAKGAVTIRLVSRSVKDYGRAFFDSWVIT